jgi:hypothetical protein
MPGEGAGAPPRAANLNLRSLGGQPPQDSEPVIGGLLNGQPLSPTQTSSNKTSQRLPRENGKQKQLKGPPQHVGLTTIEYSLEASMARAAVAIKEITQNDVQVNYCKLNISVSPVLCPCSEGALRGASM